MSIWKKRRLQLMAKAIMKKFEQNPSFPAKLLATGQEELVYASQYDSFYGIGYLMRHAQPNRDRWGKNFLGQILNVVRQRFRERAVAM